MGNKLLIKNDDEQSQLIDLFLLKSATEWLEKQNWISSPYGGDNYLEDIIFRIKVLSGKEWQSVFKTENPGIEIDQMKEYFEMLKTIDPNIRVFGDAVKKSSLHFKEKMGSD